ncbi:hypothetical protein LOK49_LG01G03436 [Camellia lanceoleosa]|uniref:Uncharacterized protein n=1 Tax=Camellia lanceoleosa TaxID=1840588 RepID=A0ACC0IZ78_9ERIC|nr:hypothetical protein LOK49_LG01G03436 [Camellia lanceoleosa]
MVGLKRWWWCDGVGSRRKSSCAAERAAFSITSAREGGTAAREAGIMADMDLREVEFVRDLSWILRNLGKLESGFWRKRGFSITSALEEEGLLDHFGQGGRCGGERGGDNGSHGFEGGGICEGFELDFGEFGEVGV